jgi:hypothetical protein
MVLTTKEVSYIIVLGIVISVLPISSTTIDSTGILCIISICLTTRMNPSTQSAQPCRSLYFVGITTAYSWIWGRNIHCWVFLHPSEKVDIVFRAGRRSWYWRIWFCGVQQMYHTEKVGTRPWKLLSRSVSVYWTQILWDSGMIPWLALVYSTLQSSPRRSTDVRQWNSWR